MRILTDHLQGFFLFQLEENFLQQVNALIQGSDSEFWRSGRFSVNIGRQLAIHNDGEYCF